MANIRSSPLCIGRSKIRNQYTLIGGQADKAVKSYLDSVVRVISERIPQAKSIVLAGGFGRGEGSVEKRGKKLIPLNDFDMFVVVDGKVDEKHLNNVANEAAESLDLGGGVPLGTDFYSFDRQLHANTFYVDLKALTPKDMTRLPPMFRYAELKQASTVVWGDSYLDLIPNYSISDLPLAEGFRLLLNRMALLCLYFSLDFTKREITSSEKHGLLYLGSKALLDLSAPLLQLRGEYVPTYLGRLERLKQIYKKSFPELYRSLPDLPKRVEDVVSFRTSPDFEKPLDPLEYWSMCKKYIGETTLFFAGKFFRREINSLSEMANLIYWKMWPDYYGPYLKHYLRHRFHIPFGSRLGSRFVQPYINYHVYKRFKELSGTHYPKILWSRRGFDLVLYSAMTNILYSVDKRGEVDARSLSQGEDLLKKVFPVSSKDGLELEQSSRWNNVNDAFSEAYANFSFLKIV